MYLKFLIICSIFSFFEFGEAIVNGTNAKITPYMASVQKNKVHLCGGAVIHPKFILTVGHFIVNQDVSEFSVVVGTLRLSNPKCQRYAVKTLIPHPNASTVFPFHYDIGLVELIKPMKLGRWIQPIPLMTYYLPAGTVLNFTGWGLADQATDYRPDRLQQVTLTIVSDADCLANYGVSGMELDQGEFCSISPRGSGPCNNDSGGPVVWEEKLYGIDSYGHSDKCDGEKPDVTTSVAFHFNWIVRTAANQLRLS